MLSSLLLSTNLEVSTRILGALKRISAVLATVKSPKFNTCVYTCPLKLEGRKKGQNERSEKKLLAGNVPVGQFKEAYRFERTGHGAAQVELLKHQLRRQLEAFCVCVCVMCAAAQQCKAVDDSCSNL